MKLDIFDNITFDEEKHIYKSNDKQIGISTTSLIHLYSQVFNEDLIAPKTALKEHKTVEQVLDEWHYKRDYSCEKGNQIHLFAQSLWNNEDYEVDYDKVDSRFIKQLKIDMEILKPQAISFYNEYHEMLELVKDEQYIYDEDYDIAGSIDLLCKSKFTGKYVIVDFKSNDNFYKKTYGKMKVPLQKLEDGNLSHYSLQLEIYKHIFEKNTKSKVEDIFIVYFNLKSDTFEIIEPLNVKKEVVKILEMRRVRNMNSVPVLIYGKSGTGKSTSLRNFKDDEIGVINVLNKPLPFKSNLKLFNSDDYASILKVISGAKAKTIVIDDAGYLITNEFMRKSSVKSYEKFNEIANNFWGLIEAIKKLEGGKTVYIIMHEDINDNGDVSPRTIGKMLNDKVCIEGMFTIVLRSMCEDGNYIFTTKTNGQDVTKTPMNMFEETSIDNDLKEVDKVIREYYELDKIEKKEGK